MKYAPLLTAILWGICYTSTGNLVNHIDIKTYLFFSCLLSTIGFLVWGMLDGSIYTDLYTSTSLMKVSHWVFISSFTSFLACFFSVSAVKYCGATTAAMIEISYPVWVIIFTYMIGNKETITWNSIIGGIIIFIGTIIVIKGK